MLDASESAQDGVTSASSFNLIVVFYLDATMFADVKSGSAEVSMQPAISTSCTACRATLVQEASPTCSGEPKRGLDSRLIAMDVQFEVRRRQHITLMSNQGSADVSMQPAIATSCTACRAAAAPEAAPTCSGKPKRGLDSHFGSYGVRFEVWRRASIVR